jgi:hypothetical protein
VLSYFADCCCNLSSSCSALQTEADVPGTVETVTECLDKVFSSRYGASLLPSYGVCVTFSFQFFYLDMSTYNQHKIPCVVIIVSSLRDLWLSSYTYTYIDIKMSSLHLYLPGIYSNWIAHRLEGYQKISLQSCMYLNVF